MAISTRMKRRTVFAAGFGLLAARLPSRIPAIEMIATEKIAFLCYHMPFPAVGFVERQDGGYRFVPKTYQFDI